ncbi:MAG: leucyl aminopeptidase family protein [Myxococcales bacterium]|nr:leucyl aminopeptidase family protein [Myxococcales bacterium]MCB9701405.1 leucyl aminopeptidase family protein [Myxococcales bacterium]
MPTLSFANSVRTAVKGSDAVVVIGPASTLAADALPALFDPPVQRLTTDLAALIKPGDLGAGGSTLTGASPGRIYVGVLPDKLSRYNTPTRAESIRRVIPAGDLGQYKKVALILILDDPSHYLAAANAVGRAFPLFSAKGGNGSDLKLTIVAIDRHGETIKSNPRIAETMETTRAIASLVDTPPSDLNPETYAHEARQLLHGLKGVKIKEIVGDALVKQGLMGIHTVGRCALAAPRMLIASYTPAGKGASERHVALVGKGVTYDTGGLNIKIQGAMPNMKCDMAGSAALLGAFRVLVASGCKHRVSLVLCIAENAIGPAAYKPDDIIRLHSGKTVEINNTDAEGRLLLADGVSYAARVLKADTVIDAATLTGAQLVATGLQHAAVVSNDDEVEKTFIAAGKESGDLVHPLPFAPELFKAEFDSAVADMCNSVRNRANAQTACAAQFVYWQIDDTGVKWCHIDLAGPAFPKNRATGFGVALVAQAVDDL